MEGPVWGYDWDYLGRGWVGIWVRGWVSSRAHVTCGRDAGRWGRLRSGHNLCECFVRHTILLFDPESILHPLTSLTQAGETALYVARSRGRYVIVLSIEKVRA